MSMPPWFLALWLQCRDLTGQVLHDLGGGAVSILSSALVSKDKNAADPAASAANCVDIQVIRSSLGATRNSRDVAVGANSGVGTNHTEGGNLCIGTAAASDGAPGALMAMSTAGAKGKRVLVGSTVYLSGPTDAANDVGGDAFFGSQITLTGGSIGENYVAGAINSLTSPPASTGWYRNVAIAGARITTPNIRSIDGASGRIAVTAFGGQIALSGTSRYITAFGHRLAVGSNGVSKRSLALIGNSLSATDLTEYTTRIGMGQMETDGSYGHAAYVDITAGSSVNTSLVTLGSSQGSSGHTSRGANAAYQFALADLGKVVDTGTASTTIPDNCSTYIVNGSGTKTITFPANPIDGQFLTITVGAAHTGITLAGGGNTLVDGTLGNTAGSVKTWMYHAGTTTWYRH